VTDIGDQGLFELASTCIGEAHELVRAREALDAWIPSVSQYPSLSQFDFGWPNISHSVLGSNVPHYSGLFGPVKSDMLPFAYSDIAHMEELVGFARTHERLADYYSLPIDGETADRLFRMQVADIVVDVLDRALHLYGDEFSDDQLREVYAEFEMGVLVEPLPVAIVVPVALTPFDFDGRVEISEGLGLERMSDEWQLARAPKGQQHGEGAGASPVVVGAATHALVLDHWELPNRKGFSNLQTHRLGFYPLEEIERFFEALRIVTGMQTGFAQISIRPIGWAHRWVAGLPAIFPGALGRRYPAWFDDWGWLRQPPAPISTEQVSEIAGVYDDLKHVGSKIGVASRRLSAAMLRDSEDDAIIDLCIGLEAALGDTSHAEITHKLALRTAAVVSASTSMDPQLVFKQVKGIYNVRSEVVHGKSGQRRWSVVGPDGDLPAITAATELLRLVLAALLERPEWRDPQRVDGLVLAGLAEQPESVPGSDA
jgi:hypothetical protein